MHANFVASAISAAVDAAATANNYSNIVATAASVAGLHLVVRAKWQLLWRLMIITRRPLLLSILGLTCSVLAFVCTFTVFECLIKTIFAVVAGVSPVIQYSPVKY